MRNIQLKTIKDFSRKGSKFCGIAGAIALVVLIISGFGPIEPKEKPCKIVVSTNNIIHPNFGGVGFHVFNQIGVTSKLLMDQVLDKRWRELNPSFARVTHNSRWNQKDIEEVAAQLEVLKNTNTEIYMTTWDPEVTKPGDERIAYVKRVTDQLEYLIKNKGLGIKNYCMTNEMTLGDWGFLRTNMPIFKDYHQTFFNEFKNRKLNLGLLASDEAKSGFDEGWPSVTWAADNMDSITAIYGGHHYEWDTPPENTDFYANFLRKMSWGGNIANKYHKNFILGEFGSRQDTRNVNGQHLDINVYYDTPSEKYITLQTAEMALAAINGGVYAMAYWTFADFPDAATGKNGYMNKWGLFKWSGNDNDTRGLYYGYGLLTRFFRGSATVFAVKADNPLIRVATVQHHDAKTWSIAVINRNEKSMPVSVEIKGLTVNRAFRKYTYNSQNEPFNPFGDMPGPDAKIAMSGSAFADTVAPLSITVYTTAYDENPPAKVQQLKLVSENGKYKLTWQENSESDLCYYRVYKSLRPEFLPNIRNQIGSTIATEFEVDNDRYVYKVIAVDKSGNASEPAVTEFTIKKDN